MVPSPHDIRILYVCFAVHAMSHTYESNSSGSTGDATHFRNFFASSASAPMRGKRKDPGKCISVALGRGSTGEALLKFRTTGEAGVAGCTVGRLVNTL